MKRVTNKFFLLSFLFFSLSISRVSGCATFDLIPIKVDGLTILAHYFYGGIEIMVIIADPNGNITAKQIQSHCESGGRGNPTSTTTYTYDYANLLSKIEYPDGQTNTFTNCRCGTFRLQKQDSHGLKNYLYDKENDSPIFETDENYNPTVRYTKGPKIDELLSKRYQTDDGTWKTVYYLYDGLGNVRQLVDEKGFIVGSYEYEAYTGPLTVESVRATI